MKPTNCTRHTFQLGARTIPYTALSRYVCAECGGGIVRRALWNESEQRSEDRVMCAACEAEDIIAESRYLEQISDGWEALQGLPDHLRALVEPEKENETCQSATEAIDDLFG